MLDSLSTQPARRCLRVEVAAALCRQSHVEQQEIERVAYQFALAVKPNDRNSQPLLIYLGEAARHRPAYRTANIRMVGNIADEGDQCFTVEDRSCQIDIWQMGSAGHMRVISDENIARRNVTPVLVKQYIDQSAY